MPRCGRWQRGRATARFGVERQSIPNDPKTVDGPSPLGSDRRSAPAAGVFNRMDEQTVADLSTRYTRFAEREAHGRSPSYEGLARGVAGDREVLGFLMTLPEKKRQPSWDHFRGTLLLNPHPVRSVMLSHSTQTNEPARCATLLPVLAQLPQPLALIEVGASAGLCLLPDLYGYDYGGTVIRPATIEIEPPVFTCWVSETTPVPTAMPEIVWRAGLDLNPLDAANPAEVAWLETLVWPEQADRLAKLGAALKIAAVQKPRLVRGDLLGNRLPQLCREAPKSATLVIFHTAVLAYVEDQAERRVFAERVMSLCQYWLSNEAPNLFPEVARRVEARGVPGRFLLSVNGIPVAWTDPHGASLEWIACQDWVPASKEPSVS